MIAIGLTAQRGLPKRKQRGAGERPLAVRPQQAACIAAKQLRPVKL
jgi:hypothetical protein